MAVLLLVYLGIWVLFGLAIHAAVAQVAWLQGHAWILGAATLILAGVYQFTPWKYVCLEKCRTPRSFIRQYWRGRNDRTQRLPRRPVSTSWKLAPEAGGATVGAP